MAPVEGRISPLVTWFMGIAVTKMGFAGHLYRIVEWDGEFQAFFHTSCLCISLSLSLDAGLTWYIANLSSGAAVLFPRVQLLQRPNLRPP